MAADDFIITTEPYLFPSDPEQNKGLISQKTVLSLFFHKLMIGGGDQYISGTVFMSAASLCGSSLQHNDAIID